MEHMGIRMDFTHSKEKADTSAGSFYHFCFVTLHSVPWKQSRTRFCRGSQSPIQSSDSVSSASSAKSASVTSPNSSF